MGNDLKPVYEPPLPGEIKHDLTDISKAQEKASYNPQYNPEAGLKQTDEYTGGKDISPRRLEKGSTKDKLAKYLTVGN